MRHQSIVITLDPEGERFARFKAANAHLPCRVLKGIRGTDFPRAERIARGIVTEACLDAKAVSDGEVGCAASHWYVWRQAAQQGIATLILEDDVITHPRLGEVIARLEDTDLDIVFFGVNTDTLLATISPEGVREFSNFEDRYPPPERIAAILAGTDLAALQYRRVLNAFGMCCYLVTPQGARKLAMQVLPLRLDAVPIVGMKGASVRGTSIDRRLNALFPDLRALVARPFLAWTPNTDSSTR